MKKPELMDIERFINLKFGYDYFCTLSECQYYTLQAMNLSSLKEKRTLRTFSEWVTLYRKMKRP